MSRRLTSFPITRFLTRHFSYNKDWQTALRPVTIRQILDCQRLHSSAPFTIDGREAKNVSCAPIYVQTYQLIMLL